MYAGAVDLRGTKWPIKSPIIPLKLSSVGVVTKFTGRRPTETEMGKQSTINCSHRRLLLPAAVINKEIWTRGVFFALVDN